MRTDEDVFRSLEPIDKVAEDDPHKFEKLTQRGREEEAKPEGDEAAEGEK